MHILWSGPRESYISDLDIFCASTTIFGSNQNSNRAYSKFKHIRVDHNQPDCISNTYCNEKLEEWIDKYPDLKILYYNAIYGKYLHKNIKNVLLDVMIWHFLNFLIQRVMPANQH